MLYTVGGETLQVSISVYVGSYTGRTDSCLFIVSYSMIVISVTIKKMYDGYLVL